MNEYPFKEENIMNRKIFIHQQFKEWYIHIIDMPNTSSYTLLNERSPLKSKCNHVDVKNVTCNWKIYPSRASEIINVACKKSLKNNECKINFCGLKVQL